MRLVYFFRDKIKKHGWKAVLGIFIYYLVRDLTLYVIVPYWFVRSVTAP